jgi:small GTP-binding protein
MSSTQEQLSELMQNYFDVVNALIGTLVYDRGGLLIAQKERKISNAAKSESEIYGALTGIIEQTLTRIKTYEIGTFGNSTIDTEDHRIVFTEAGPHAILLSVFPADIELNNVLPYCFLVAEKVALILDNNVTEHHSLTIPNLEMGFELGLEPTAIMRKPIQLDNNKEPKKTEMRFKLVVVGDSSVGKTSLINQFVTRKFVTDYRPTLGISITSQIYRIQGFEEAKINFMVWDVAGQKFFQRVRKHYYSSAHAAFIVYDITNRASFDNIDIWYEDMQKQIPKVPIVIVANKKDLEENRAVSLAEGRAKAKALKCMFMETSAKTGENVRDAFNILGIGLFFKAESTF